MDRADCADYIYFEKNKYGYGNNKDKKGRLDMSCMMKAVSTIHITKYPIMGIHDEVIDFRYDQFISLDRFVGCNYSKAENHQGRVYY